MGKKRIIAETGAGQHGVATATVCALLGLECVVYMGAEDMRRQQPNVYRMQPARREVAPVDAGARTLKEAGAAAIRDWVTNVANTHYIIGSAVGPRPIRRWCATSSGSSATRRGPRCSSAEGRLPDRWSPASAAAQRHRHVHAFVDDADVELVGVEAGGRGPGRPGATARR